MIRLAGLVLLAAAGALAGAVRAAELFRRVRLLEILDRTLQHFGAGIRYGARPLEELISREEDCPFCRAARELPSFGEDPRQALLEAGETLLHRPGDRAFLEELIRPLGSSDAQGQLEHLELCRQRLAGMLDSARTRRDRDARLGVAVGAFGGLALGLILW